MAAGHSLFFQYKSGVIDQTMGCPTSMDHAMVIVGYEMIGGETKTITTESYDHCDIIKRDDYYHCDVFQDEIVEERKRCRRARGSELTNEECTRKPQWEEFFEEFTNRRGRTKKRCCRMTERVI